MPLKYQINVLEELKAAGYSTYRLRQENIFGQRIIQRLRHNQSVSFEVLAKLCELLNCNLNYILEYEEEN